MCFCDRLHIHTWIHTLPATISSPDTRRHGNLLPSLSLLLFIYSFIYWLILVPSPHPGIPQQRFRAELNRRWGLIFSGMCHAIFVSAAAARWGLPILSASRELKAERRGWKKSCIHLAGGTFWWHVADLFTRPARRFCVICELNNSRIKKKEFNLFAKMIIISRTCGRVRLLVCFCFVFFQLQLLLLIFSNHSHCPQQCTT